MFLDQHAPLNALTDEVLFYELATAQNNCDVGLVVLNRPKKINVLNQKMVASFHHQLKIWQDQANIQLVVVIGQGEKGYCAGGDVKACLDPDYAQEFFASEYALDKALIAYPKPVIHWVHGNVMGGGVGLMHSGDLIIAHSQAQFAMPEVFIGFFPDVGLAYKLSRMPQGVGAWLSLTGASIGAHQALAIKLVDCIDDTGESSAAALDTLLHTISHWSPAANLQTTDLGQACCAYLKNHYSSSNDSNTQHNILPDSLQQWCDDFWSSPLNAQDFFRLITEAELIEANNWSKALPGGLSAASVMSLVVTGLWLKTAKNLTQDEVFAGDETLAQWFFEHGDFIEGVTARLVDKRDPRWLFQSVQAAFAQLKAHKPSALASVSIQ